MDAFEGAARRVRAVLSDGHRYLERYLERPADVDVQILARQARQRHHLGERDMPIQRRHPEAPSSESPGPWSMPEMREKIGKIGVDAARAVKLPPAGQIEGWSQAGTTGGEYFFLRMTKRVAGRALRDAGDEPELTSSASKS